MDDDDFEIDKLMPQHHSHKDPFAASQQFEAEVVKQYVKDCHQGNKLFWALISVVNFTNEGLWRKLFIQWYKLEL